MKLLIYQPPQYTLPPTVNIQLGQDLGPHYWVILSQSNVSSHRLAKSVAHSRMRSSIAPMVPQSLNSLHDQLCHTTPHWTPDRDLLWAMLAPGSQDRAWVEKINGRRPDPKELAPTAPSFPFFNLCFLWPLRPHPILCIWCCICPEIPSPGGLVHRGWYPSHSLLIPVAPVSGRARHRVDGLGPSACLWKEWRYEWQRDKATLPITEHSHITPCWLIIQFLEGSFELVPEFCWEVERRGCGSCVLGSGSLPLPLCE
jgi:hypothetical protein